LKNEEGRVIPQVLVGADGRPETCRILSSSNFPELDAGSCELMMQMRFEPARDASGRAIPSQYSRPLVWLLTDPRPFASSSIRTRVTIRNGRLQSCEVVRGEGAYIAAWSALACNIFSDVEYYFGAAADRPLSAIIEVRLNAGDRAPLLGEPWPTGNALSSEKLSFVVNRDGDASACTPLESRGFGPRGLNNLSDCGRLLSILWFKVPRHAASPASGIFETRVYPATEQLQTTP
jgi:TonB family protein